MRAVRGAITASGNTVEAIEEATCSMLKEIERLNRIGPDDVVSAFFSLTADLNATYPARAARSIGWDAVPMLDTVEVDVPGGLRRTIRVLLHVDVSRPVRHAYLGEARSLRPDLGSDS
ncbi:MAG TPA: chorismate mutase [Chloroflexota bacterium]|nr:chorismate mutase [Chloroflexota bacterium]